MIPCAIETMSGRMFDFEKPRADMVDIDDIARALGNTARFGGHTRRFYSVAEHAAHVYRLVHDAGWPPDVCYAALHHDSHEAYVGDIPSPLKRLLQPGWSNLEWRVDLAICKALRVPMDLLQHDAVKAADAQMLAYEAAVLKPSGRAQWHGAWQQLAPSDVPDWAWRIGVAPDPVRQHFVDCHYDALECCHA